MQYDRTKLRATAVSVKEAWEAAYHADHAKRVAKFEEALVRWRDRDKAKAVERLQGALALARKDKPYDAFFDRYGNSRLPQPPTRPEDVDCCTPTTQSLDGLIEFLDTITDDDVSSNALHVAGFKDLAKMLRRPC